MHFITHELSTAVAILSVSLSILMTFCLLFAGGLLIIAKDQIEGNYVNVEIHVKKSRVGRRELRKLIEGSLDTRCEVQVWYVGSQKNHTEYYICVKTYDENHILDPADIKIVINRELGQSNLQLRQSILVNSSVSALELSDRPPSSTKSQYSTRKISGLSQFSFRPSPAVGEEAVVGTPFLGEETGGGEEIPDSVPIVVEDVTSKGEGSNAEDAYTPGLENEWARMQSAETSCNRRLPEG